jgi:hypothetical protein
MKTALEKLQEVDFVSMDWNSSEAQVESLQISGVPRVNRSPSSLQKVVSASVHRQQRSSDDSSSQEDRLDPMQGMLTKLAQSLGGQCQGSAGYVPFPTQQPTGGAVTGTVSAGVAQAPDLNQLLSLLIMQNLAQQQDSSSSKNGKKKNKKKAKDSSSEQDSSGTDSEVGGSNSITTSFERFEKLKERRVRAPRKIIRAFRSRAVKKLRIRPGRSIAYEDLWSARMFYKCKSMGKIAWVILEVMQNLEDSQPDVAYATAIRGWQAIKQFAIDGGSWRAAWPLTLLEDPTGIDEFGGTEEDLAVVGGLLRARQDLREKVKPYKKNQDVDEEDKDEEHAEANKNKKGGKK